MKKFIYLLFIFLSFTINACENDNPCVDNVVSRINAGFYTLSNDNESAFTVSDFSMYGIDRQDSVLHGSNVRIFDFPLSMHEASSSYILTVNTLTDTLELFYTSKLAFVSVECGFTNNFEIQSLSITNNFIDSISIVKNNVDLSDEENLKIFL